MATVSKQREAPNLGDTALPASTANSSGASLSLVGDVANLLRFHELLYLFTLRDIRVRYKQSAMGVLWAVFMPALIVGSGTLVRIAAAKWSGREVTVQDMGSVIVRAVIWSFFASAIRFGTNSLTNNSNLVTKIAFPKELFPISAVMSSLVDFLVATVVAAIALPIVGVPLSLKALWAIPLLAVMIILATGLALVLSAANLFFRDVKYLVEIFLSYAIFFTPVLYPAKLLGHWQNIVLLNPIAPVLEATSSVIVGDATFSSGWTAYCVAFSLLLLVFGYWFFKRLETAFAERI
jgi:lipopolysaccharide transport system permease protein